MVHSGGGLLESSLSVSRLRLEAFPTLGRSVVAGDMVVGRIKMDGVNLVCFSGVERGSQGYKILEK
jgi:hypothetical protein